MQAAGTPTLQVRKPSTWVEDQKYRHLKASMVHLKFSYLEHFAFMNQAPALHLFCAAQLCLGFQGSVAVAATEEERAKV